MSNPSQKAYYRSYRPRKQFPPKTNQDLVLERKVKAIVASEAKRAWKKSESKVYDRAIVQTSIDYIGLTYDLTGSITQGSGVSQYIASSIAPTVIRIKWNALVGDATNMFRIIVLQTIGGGVPTTATVLASVTNVRAPLSAYDTDYMRTYKVLHDELYSLVASTTSAQITGDIRIPANKLRQVDYVDASGTVEAGGLYMLLVSDSAAATHPVFQAYSRVYFKDS